MLPLVQLGPVLNRLSSTEERLVASAVIVVVAVLLGAIVTPLLVRHLRRLLAQRYFGGSLGDWMGRLNERFPITTPVGLFLRSLQVVVISLTLVALVLVWQQAALLLRITETIQFRPATVIRTVFTIALAVAAYVGMGLVEDFITSFGQETDRMTAHQEQIVTRVTQITLLIAVGLVGLSIWNVSPGGILVGAGFLGIVVGLAARQTLGALIAGFVLMFSRPFEIGDWVAIDDEEGIVTDITIVNTRLENFDGEFVVLPNDKVADSAITNRSQKGRLRLRVDVGVDYETDPDHAVEVAEEAIETVDVVESAPAPHVFPREFGDSAIVLEVRFWIEHPSPPKRWQAHAKVIRAVKLAFDREGITIPYPQRELSGRAETGGFRVHDGRDPATSEPEAFPDGDGPEEER
jgi:small-conductance mechanosensitive channel